MYKTKKCSSSSIIKTKDDLVDRVVEEYRNYDVEFSDEFLHGIIVSMTKADFMRAYAEIQMQCNGDRVIRLKDEHSQEESPEFIPEVWERTFVAGDAQQILIGINELRQHEGPIYARRMEDGTILDLIWGEFCEAH